MKKCTDSLTKDGKFRERIIMTKEIMRGHSTKMVALLATRSRFAGSSHGTSRRVLRRNSGAQIIGDLIDRLIHNSQEYEALQTLVSLAFTYGCRSLSVLEHHISIEVNPAQLRSTTTAVTTKRRTLSIL